MKYIIMCGGQYRRWKTPKHLLEVGGEPIVARTIRLLKDNGVTDIAISAHDERFERFGVPVLKHDNFYYVRRYNEIDGHWANAFYPMDEPVCYIFGDVIFSSQAIKKIVETPTDDIELFGSAPPFHKDYPKDHEEPFALKVWDIDHLHESVKYIKEHAEECWRKPLVWELWCVIKGRRIDIRDYQVDYTIINDYTCDIDDKKDIANIKRVK